MVPSRVRSPFSGLGPFRRALAEPGARAFTCVGIFARLPIAMMGLGIVLLITSHDFSYAIAGALAASFALAEALIAPYGARFVDRLGQRRVLPVLAIGQAMGLVLLVVGVEGGWPLPALFAICVFAGGIGPNVGALVRARWIGLLSGDPRLRAAFAWESIADEVVFILGPPLATALALGLSPAAPLLACAALIAVGCIALARLRSTDPPPRPVAAGTRSGHAVRLPGMPALILLMVLLGVVFGAFEVTTVAFAAGRGEPGLTGVILAVYAFGSLLGGVLLGSLRLPGSVTEQLRTACVLLAVATAPVPLVPGVGTLAIAAMAAGFAVAPVLILATTLLEVLVPVERITEALTVTTSGIAVGLAVGAPLAGIIVDNHAPQTGYFLMSAAAVAAVGVMLASHRGLARREADRHRQ